MSGAAAIADPPPPVRFPYHRRLSPMIGVLLGLALAEAAVVDLVAAAWLGAVAAGVLLALHAVAVALLVRMLVQFRRRPIELGAGVLRLHTGGLIRLDVGLDAIAGFRDGWTAADLKATGVLDMALVAWPTIVLDLSRPLPRRRRSVTAIAHCPDDPGAFRAAVEAVIRCRGAAAGNEKGRPVAGAAPSNRAG